MQGVGTMLNSTHSSCPYGLSQAESLLKLRHHKIETNYVNLATDNEFILMQCSFCAMNSISFSLQASQTLFSAFLLFLKKTSLLLSS